MFIVNLVSNHNRCIYFPLNLFMYFLYKNHLTNSPPIPYLLAKGCYVILQSCKSIYFLRSGVRILERILIFKGKFPIYIVIIGNTTHHHHLVSEQFFVCLFIKNFAQVFREAWNQSNLLFFSSDILMLLRNVFKQSTEIHKRGHLRHLELQRNISSSWYIIQILSIWSTYARET